MFKKIVSSILVLTLCFGLPINVYASEDLKQNIVSVINNSENIDENMIEEILETTSAALIYDDGTVIPLETEIVIEDIGSSEITRSGGNIYSVTSTTKIDIESADKDDENVLATVTLQMIWEDVLGPVNKLVNYSGEIRVTKGTMKTVKISYGNAYEMADAECYEMNWSLKTFYGDVNKNYVAPFVSCDVKFKDAKYSLYVMVKSSVFD